MTRDNWKLALEFSVAFTVAGWLAMMVSFWLPHFASQALLSTALCIGIPGLVGAVALLVFEEEITTARKSAAPLRCTDCGSKILNAGGTTVGDQIEGELMAGPWKRNGRD